MNPDFLYVPAAPDPQPWTWSEVNILRAMDVVHVMNTVMKEYWPVGVRGVYYQVISLSGFSDKWYWRSTKGPTKGRPLANYVDVIGEILKWCRIDPTYHLRIPMNSINDEGRQVGAKIGFSSNSQFFNQQIDGVFNGYSNCLAQNQPDYIEVWVEKQGLFHIADRASKKFCRRTMAVRGYPSVTMLNDFADRTREVDQPLILYFGDMDVDGMEIPKTFMRSLWDEHGTMASVVRCGLNPAQISSLKADPVGIKGSGKPKANFLRDCGNKAYELDAVPPAELEQLVYDSIEAYTDMDVLEADKKAGNITRAKFDVLQERVEDYAEEVAGNLGLIHT